MRESFLEFAFGRLRLGALIVLGSVSVRIPPDSSAEPVCPKGLGGHLAFEPNKSLGKTGERGSCRAYDAMVRQEPHPTQARNGLGKLEENMFRGVASPSR